MTTEPTTEQQQQLTPEQIQNWRNALSKFIGPSALMMSDEDVQKMRDEMQKQVGE